MLFRGWLLILPILLVMACESPVTSADRVIVDLGAADRCDATMQSCLLSRGSVELRLELEKNIRTLQPFDLQLRVVGIEPQTIEEVVVEFFMEGMDMGVNRYLLLPTSSGWQGKITLPVCVAGRSDWRAVVDVSDKERRYRATFRFHSSG